MYIKPKYIGGRITLKAGHDCFKCHLRLDWCQCRYKPTFKRILRVATAH